MSDELRPCPVCGCAGRSKGDDSYGYVGCYGCSYATEMFDSEEEARDTWNNYRPIEDALRAEITTLKGKIAEVKQWNIINTLAEIDDLKSELAQKDADLAAWQAHSAGLAVMIKALEELVEAWEDYHFWASEDDDHWNEKEYQLSKKSLKEARAKVEALKEGKSE